MSKKPPPIPKERVEVGKNSRLAPQTVTFPQISASFGSESLYQTENMHVPATEVISTFIGLDCVSSRFARARDHRGRDF
jgi:hypothetical protein